jgi:hypothetical protein
VIYNVVIHVTNEQPLMADLFDLPAASDAGLLCTNVRSMDGKPPLFIQHVSSTFFFPYRVVRFLEIPAGAIERHRAETPTGEPAAFDVDREAPAEPASLLTVLAPEPDEAGADASESEDELVIDEDFLQRIRDI